GRRGGRLKINVCVRLGVEVADVVFLFFFFQAEDGIRCWSVTGVQTYALPISSGACELAAGATLPPTPEPRTVDLHLRSLRSEERRVGKEGRSRGSPHH